MDTQEKIREDCIDPCMDLAHLHKDAAMLLCKADDMERTEQRACRKAAYAEHKIQEDICEEIFAEYFSSEATE